MRIRLLFSNLDAYKGTIDILLLIPLNQNEVSPENLRELSNYFYKPSVDATEDALFQTIYSLHDIYV